MWNDAFAQAAATPAGPPSNPAIALVIQFAPILLIFAVMYLLMIRPQQQRQKQMDLMLKALKKGDRVVTTGGLIGTVVGVEDAKVVLRISDEVKAEFTKASVVQVLAEAGA